MKSLRKNEQIRIPKVLLIKDGQKLGIFSTYDAIKLAQEEGLDLVEISPDQRPPVCAIMDFGKHQYEQSKKQKHKISAKEKEITLRYVIDQNDLNTKINQAKNWLSHGDRVKIMIRFKARENAHKDQGMAVIKRVMESLTDVCTVERQPVFEGNQIICRLIPKGK